MKAKKPKKEKKVKEQSSTKMLYVAGAVLAVGVIAYAWSRRNKN